MAGITRRSLKNLEKTSLKGQNELPTLKPKIENYLTSKGYKLDKPQFESDWLKILNYEFGLKGNEVISSGKFSSKEIKKIEDYRLKIEGDLMRRTNFSSTGTIYQGPNPYAIPDSVVRRIANEKLEKLDNILHMWDLIAIGGLAIGATTMRNKNATSERVVLEKTEKFENLTNNITERPTINNVDKKMNENAKTIKEKPSVSDPLDGITNTEIEAAVGINPTSEIMIHAPAENMTTKTKPYGSGQYTEFKFDAKSSESNAEGNVRTTLKIHDADMSAKEGSNSKTGTTLGIEQGNKGNRRVVSDQSSPWGGRWINKSEATDDEWNAAHIPIFRNDASKTITDGTNITLKGLDIDYTKTNERSTIKKDFMTIKDDLNESTIKGFVGKDNDEIGKLLKPFLGEDIMKLSEQIGMNQKDVKNYLSRLQMLENIKNPEGDIAVNISRTAKEQITKTYDVLGSDLAKEVKSYGYNPKHIADHIDYLKSNGYGISEIKYDFKKTMKLADFLKDKFYNGDINKTKASIAGCDGNVKNAIKVEKWDQLVKEWKDNHPLETPGRERLEQFGNDAEKYVNEVEKDLIKNPSTSLKEKSEPNSRIADNVRQNIERNERMRPRFT